MFIILGKKQCPSCGVHGKKWGEEKNVYMCPTCNTIFNEFGIIAQPEDKEETIA